MIELVSPHDPELPCAVTNMVEKQPCTLYHIGLKTYDLRAELKRLKGNGFRQVGEILTTSVYGYERSGTFLFALGMGLIELVEERKPDDGIQ